MKKFLSIFVALIALCACNSEEPTAADSPSVIEENNPQLSRSGSTHPMKYHFINLMVGEDIERCVARESFLQSDAAFLLSRNATERIQDIAHLKSMVEEGALEEFEDMIDQKLLDFMERRS